MIAILPRRLAAAVLFLTVLSLPWGSAVFAQAMQLSPAAVRAALIPGGENEIGLQVRLAPGWKFYWRTPGEGGVPAQFDWSGSQNLAGADIAWPAPQRIAVGQADLYGYTDEVVLPIRLKPMEAGQPVSVHLTLEYGVCKDICILRTDRLQHQAGTRPGPADLAQLARWRARVPQPAMAAGLQLMAIKRLPDALVVTLQSGAPFNNPDLFVEAGTENWFGRPEVSFSADRREAKFRLAAAPTESVSQPLRLTLVDQALAAEMVLKP
ncbi:protein-disulfide reductase DsbD domain-containing protein [Ferrovibrio sp.]|jgi:suppressor for copper-sensitivity B|uniref:protein-disulfide reductase DsbD domain-containing protein n=1 Tax=Ferrovibrio sp. TaxID=1917215 RepID=UPI0035ADBA63